MKHGVKILDNPEPFLSPYYPYPILLLVVTESTDDGVLSCNLKRVRYLSIKRIYLHLSDESGTHSYGGADHHPSSEGDPYPSSEGFCLF